MTERAIGFGLAWIMRHKCNQETAFRRAQQANEKEKHQQQQQMFVVTDK